MILNGKKTLDVDRYVFRRLLMHQNIFSRNTNNMESNHRENISYDKDYLLPLIGFVDNDMLNIPKLNFK